MWKQARESGLSLAELLVVLAITVVLAAILLPAINTPSQPDGTADVSLDPYVVAADGNVNVVPRIRDNRSDVRAEHSPVVSDAPEPAAVVEVLPAFETTEVKTQERDGLREFKTTDISYKLP
jgi:uncharacterized membrane protein